MVFFLCNSGKNFRGPGYGLDHNYYRRCYRHRVTQLILVVNGKREVMAPKTRKIMMPLQHTLKSKIKERIMTVTVTSKFE